MQRGAVESLGKTEHAEIGSVADNRPHSLAVDLGDRLGVIWFWKWHVSIYRRESEKGVYLIPRICSLETTEVLHDIEERRRTVFHTEQAGPMPRIPPLPYYL